jgi:hypothetical protein
MPEPIHLNTIKEILAVLNEKNVDTFIIDFTNWLKIRVEIKGMEAFLVDKNPDTFRWIDDGKNNCHITIHEGEK